MSTGKQAEERYPRIGIAPVFHSPAVARCCDAWNNAFARAARNGVKSAKCHLYANEAYPNSMPPLDGPENIREYIGCVAYGILVYAFPETTGTRLLYAAQVAAGACRTLAKLPPDASGKPSRETQTGAESTPTPLRDARP